MAFELDALQQRQEAETSQRSQERGPASPGGIPWWGWALGGIALLILVVLLARGRGSGGGTSATPIIVNDNTPSTGPSGYSGGSGGGGTGDTGTYPPTGGQSGSPPPSSGSGQPPTGGTGGTGGSTGGTGGTSGGTGGSTGQQSQPKYVTVQKWPAQQSTLSGIAQSVGISLAQVEALNPWIYQQRHSWDMLYAGDQVRVA